MGLFTKKTTVAVIETAKPAAPAGPEIDLEALAPGAWGRYDAAAKAVADIADRLTAVRREIARIENSTGSLENELETGREAVALLLRAKLTGKPAPVFDGRDMAVVRAELERAEVEIGVAREVRDELAAEAVAADEAARMAWNGTMDAAARALAAQAREAAGKLLGQAFALRKREFNDNLPGIGGGLVFRDFLAAVFDGCSQAEIPGLPWRPVNTSAPRPGHDFGISIGEEDDDDAPTGQAEVAGF